MFLRCFDGGDDGEFFILTMFYECFMDSCRKEGRFLTRFNAIYYFLTSLHVLGGGGITFD